MTPTRNHRSSTSVSFCSCFAGDGPSHTICVAILLAVCVAFGALRWLHLGTLWGAGPLWLLQSATAHGGELPYRDFSLSYPPLSLWLLQGAYRLLGPTFLTAQLVIDTLSVAIVLLIYAVSARLMSRPLALVATLLAIAMSDSGFQLFALQMYTPSMMVGAAGLLMMVLGVIDRIRTGHDTLGAWACAAVGACVGILSKPEFLAGTIVCVVAVCLLAAMSPGPHRLRKIGMSAGPILAGAAIGVAILVSLGRAVGMDKMMTALGGYGLARIACPWWPTGLGLFGGIASLGAAAALAALLTLLWYRSFERRFGVYYYLALALAAVGVLLYVLYVISFVTESEAAQSYAQIARTLGNRFGLNQSAAWGIPSYLLTKRNVFLPTTWVTIAFAVIFTFRKLFLHASTSWRSDSFYVLAMIVGGLTARQMFGDYAEAYPNATVAANPLLNILIVAFLFHVTRWIWQVGQDSESRAVRAGTIAAVLFLVLYGGLRTVISTTSELRAGYHMLATRAGNVALNDPESVAILDYIEIHSGPGDQLVDIGSNSNGSFYGGGTNFASRLATPIFSNIFTDITPPDWILAKDEASFRAAMPKFVIGTDPLQSLYGLTASWNRCPFPSFVWAPHTANFDTDRRFPVIEFIKLHYRKVFQFGRWSIFRPKQEVPVNHG